MKADLTSAFLIARDGGDEKGQPVCMKPPREWLDHFDEWLAKQSDKVKNELRDGQVDGNIYGRQPAASQYRDKLEDIIVNNLPGEGYDFVRGKLDGCVFHCRKTKVAILHHIDDFDVTGPEEHLDDLLKVQLPKYGCKVKVGEMEYPDRYNKTSSEFLGRTKINVEEAVLTKPNEKHTDNILKLLGLENCKSSPVPGKKLEVNEKTEKPLSESEKKVYQSCVGSAIYLSQDRIDIKFSVKELSKRMPVATPRVWCDSSAALQAAKRIGVGKIRHISLAHLYVQELTRTKQVIIGKVKGDSNPADCLTKYLPTGEAVKKGQELTGMVNLCEEGLDDHVRKTALTKVSAVCLERKNNVDYWKPISASRLNIRQFSIRGSHLTDHGRCPCSEG